MSPALRTCHVICLCAGLALPAGAIAGSTVQQFDRDAVLGTSYRLIVVCTSESEAEQFDKTVMAEIERLRIIFSTYDPTSQISRLNTQGQIAGAAPELLDVLGLYDRWRARSGGVLDAGIGELLDLWSRAEKANQLPAAAAIEPLVAATKRPSWRVNPGARSVTLVPGRRLNVDAVAKGYIIDKAVTAGMQKHRAVTGVLLDIGGDVLVRGEYASPMPGESREGDGRWRLGIADPLHSQDNAAPLTQLLLRDQAVASSGDYERFFTIGGKRYPRILDPRTGYPIKAVHSATVVAPDAATADALATILCILPVPEGLDLIGSTRGTECLIVSADGKQHRSDGFPALEAASPASSGSVHGDDDSWPSGFAMTISLTLPSIKARNYKRPYVAVWIEDGAGRIVRTVELWGKKPKYVKDLPGWWKASGRSEDLVQAISRATRSPGRYRLVWDGKDNEGSQVSPGEYVVCAEVAREHGGHELLRGTIDCRGKPVHLSLKPRVEFAAVELSFGPRENAP